MKISQKNVEFIKAFDGIFRKTLVYNDNLMLCYFMLHKGSEVPLHFHKEHQIGYVLKGKLKFITENGTFIVKEGNGYLFDSYEKHGAIILEDSNVIDIFNPSREDYK